MAMLSSGIYPSDSVNFSEEAPTVGEIAIDLCVPPDATHLAFDFKFYSEELPEWCGSSFMDAFTVSLQSAGGPDLTIASWDVNAFCEGQTTGSIPVTEADVSFDQGGVLMSEWLSWKGALAGGAGSAVTLVFRVEDANDAIYDTAVLLDRIRFCAEDDFECLAPYLTPDPEPDPPEPELVDIACLEEKCAEPLAACLDDPICPDVLECVLGCEVGAVTCVQDCVDLGGGNVPAFFLISCGGSELCLVPEESGEETGNSGTEGGQGDCDAGLLENCNGGCTPAAWLGDEFCDLAFNCEEFNYDGGTCEETGDPPVDFTCFDYKECVDQCTSGSGVPCTSTCNALLNEGNEQYDAMMACIEGECQANGSIITLLLGIGEEECMSLYFDEDPGLLSIFGGGGLPGGGAQCLELIAECKEGEDPPVTSDELTCGQYQACVSVCYYKWWGAEAGLQEDCYAECGANTPSSEQGLLEAYGICYSDPCSEFFVDEPTPEELAEIDSCVYDTLTYGSGECWGEFATCWDEPFPNGSGLNCNEAYICSEFCENGVFDSLPLVGFLGCIPAVGCEDFKNASSQAAYQAVKNCKQASCAALVNNPPLFEACELSWDQPEGLCTEELVECLYTALPDGIL